MEKYYKLYILMENKLFSKFGERKYQISSRQYTERGIRVRVISEERPGEVARQEEATLEDGYLYLMGLEKKIK